MPDMNELLKELKPAPPPCLPLPERVTKIIIKLLPPPIKKELEKSLSSIMSAIEEGSKAWRL